MTSAHEARQKAAEEARDRLMEGIALALIELAREAGKGNNYQVLALSDRISDLRRHTDRDRHTGR